MTELEKLMEAHLKSKKPLSPREFCLRFCKHDVALHAPGCRYGVGA